MANGNFQAAGSGAVSGASKGLTLGSNPALMGATSGLSAPIGAALGATIGGITAAQKNKRANQAQNIPMVDPMELQRLAQLELERKNIVAGTDPMTQNMLQQNAVLNRATQSGIAKNTGGNSSATIDGFLRAQGNSQRGINEINANAQQRIPYFDNAQASLLSRVADRKLELQLLKRAQLTAENAQARTDNNVSSNASISTGMLDDVTKASGGSGGPEGGIGGFLGGGKSQSIPTMQTGANGIDQAGMNLVADGNENSLLNLTSFFSK